jgi:MFS superfamily sulfate permease-like transporter
MKAIGTAVIGHPGQFAAPAVWSAGLFTGALWLVLGLTGAVTWVARITPRPVVHGLVLGLGLGFIGEGLRMAEGDPRVALVAAALALVLIGRDRVPTMLVLLAFGLAVALVRRPDALASLSAFQPSVRLPGFALAGLTWPDLVTGVVALGLPQAALTLGNAVIATVDENNRLFPDRPTTVKAVALDHGVMNLAAAVIGGVPMCHGAGGLAGHVRFGARTGGAVVMLGGVLLVLGLLFADAVTMLFGLLPPALLGVVLAIGGLELAAGTHTLEAPKDARYVTILTAAVAMWHMAAAFAVGLVVAHAVRRGWIRF